MADGNETIEVSVLFFARAHELAGRARDSLVLPKHSTVAQAEEALRRKFPLLGAHIDRCRIAVDQEFAEPSRELEDGSELAVIPPVSGG